MDTTHEYIDIDNYATIEENAPAANKAISRKCSDDKVVGISRRRRIGFICLNLVLAIIVSVLTFIAMMYITERRNEEKLERKLEQQSVKLQNYIVNLEKKIWSQDKIFEKQQEDIRVLMKDCLSMNNNSDALRKRSGQSPVAFTYINNPDIPNLGENQAVKFTTRVTDATYSYFPASGEFVAPASGYYLFFLQVRAVINKTCLVEIVKNGRSLASSFSESKLHHDSDSTFASVHLNAGDNVWVRNKQYKSTSCTIDDLSSFSGILFHSDEL